MLGLACVHSGYYVCAARPGMHAPISLKTVEMECSRILQHQGNAMIPQHDTTASQCNQQPFVKQKPDLQWH